MEDLGININDIGAVLSSEELRRHRLKRGLCVDCGRKCYQKKLFKLVPITEHGKVLEGRCLNCKPLNVENEHTVLPAEVNSARPSDIIRFKHSERMLTSKSSSNVANNSLSDRSFGGQRSHRRAHTSGAPSSSLQSSYNGSERQVRRLKSNVNVSNTSSGSSHNLNMSNNSGSSMNSSHTFGRTDSDRSRNSATEQANAAVEEKQQNAMYTNSLALCASRQILDGYRERKAASQNRQTEDTIQEHTPGHEPQEDSKPQSQRGMTFDGDSSLRSLDQRSSLSVNSAGSNGAKTRSFTLSQEKDMNILDDANSSNDDVIEIMKKHNDNSAILEKSFQSIACMELTESEQDSICSKGGVTEIIHGMSKFPNDKSLQTSACRALLNLTESQKCQAEVGEKGGVDCILRAMIFNLDNRELQDHALATLGNIACVDENHSRVVEKDGVEKIVSVMNAHCNEVGVVEKGCVAFTNLATTSSEIKKKIGTSGGAEAVVVSMVMNPDDSQLQYKALRALRNICASVDENKILVANVGGLDAVIMTY